MDILCQVLAKPSWWIKMNDATILAFHGNHAAALRADWGRTTWCQTSASRLEVAKWAEMTKDVPAEETQSEEFQAQRRNFFENFTDKAVVLNIPQLPSTFDYQQEYPRLPLAGKNLQVIVKIASIELTPDNPKYTGGSWHVEGMTNESIAATGILYYDCENITTSKLAFRHIFFDASQFDPVINL
ncbi:hypothetical protein AC1031_005746 [Aphanomyces cochlioides]|nr:hypothetical protein AC1031_005746 [Aphanomyces cochlioides]